MSAATNSFRPTRIARPHHLRSRVCGPPTPRALTGSPFEPVTHDEPTYQIAQANNALVFPGLGLGVAVVKAIGSATG